METPLTQLASEFNSMPERRELYAKFGIAAEAAQLFELELGTFLLGLRGLEGEWYMIPPGPTGNEVLDKINRSTMGQLLKAIGRHMTIEGDLAAIFDAGLTARNRLMHGFFERHNFAIQTEPGRARMIRDLDQLHTALFDAWQAASNVTLAFQQAILKLRDGRTSQTKASS